MVSQKAPYTYRTTRTPSYILQLRFDPHFVFRYVDHDVTNHSLLSTLPKSNERLTGSGYEPTTPSSAIVRRRIESLRRAYTQPNYPDPARRHL